jgi:type IV secretion system protein VirD4
MAGLPVKAAGTSELLVLIAAVTVASLAVIVWATGAIGGLIATGRAPELRADATVSVLVRLPRHLAEPRQAWPGPWSTRLPSAVWLYAIAIAVAAVLVVAALAAVSLAGRLFHVFAGWWRPVAQGPRRRPALPPPRRGRLGGARWATRRDLADLRAPRRGDGRLVLGRAGRILVATEARHSVLVLGPTQSGKTSGLAIPALLEWPGAAVATSVKADLVAVTRRARAGLGRVWVFDPTATAGSGPAARWSPLAEAVTWGGAQRMASWLVEASPSRAGMSDGPFWFSAAAKLLAPLLLAAAVGGRSMTDVVRWANTQDGEEPEGILGDAAQPDASAALFASAGRDDRIRSSVYTTLETVLAPYEDPLVAASADHPDIDPAALLDGCNTLYLCGPAHEQHRIQGVFSALVSAVVNAAVERVERVQGGAALQPPLLMVLDEAANIAPVRDLDTLASTAAGLGIQLVTVCQDLAQLSTRYGPDRARTIANNHRAKVVLSGIADVGTLDTLSGLAGDQAVREETVTSDLRDGRRSTSSAIAYRRLAPADELRRIRPGEGVLIYGHLPAARLTLRPWYREAGLRRRVSGPPG